MSRDIDSLARYWSEAEVFNSETRNEITQLIEQNDTKELNERFYRDLEFGTGGLRGILGAGTNRMNLYNVRKASHALASYIKESSNTSGSTLLKVAISYDSRKFSREFAEASAEVMAAHGIHSYVTKDLRPTPMLSFMVRHYKCQGGICVTASHNPPDYNGYKVYWSTGGQIVPPHDENIINHYQSTDSYEDIPIIEFQKAKLDGLITEVADEFDELYFNKVQELAIRGQSSPIKIVYTPLHGTGAYPIGECLRRFGFDDVHVVESQAAPDGSFPTVAYPNPEDPAALQIAINTAKEMDADLVLATDPDADRIGIVIRENGQYTMLNGNQIGSLLVDYVLSSLKEAHRLPQDPMVIKTVVTTDLQADIASYYGATCLETLTGFKWICQLIEDIEQGKIKPHRNYVCGGEESFGFLIGDFVRDKDAVSACCIAAEMVSYYKSKNKTLSQVLDDLFLRHGVYLEDLHTLTLPGQSGSEKINEIMKALRQNPPTVIEGICVKKFNDLKSGQKFINQDNSFQADGSISLPRSNVLQFEMEDGSKVSARPSGTEPKIKFYFSVKMPINSNCSSRELAQAKELCANKLHTLKQAFISITEI